MDYTIGIDIGGTFTDAVAVRDDGTVKVSKALSTDDLSTGVLNALTQLASKFNIGVRQLLKSTSRFVNGTTVVTNSVAEFKGAKVGLLVTRGFKDTLRIGRSPRNDQIDLHKQVNRPDLLPRECIAEIDERIDYTGSVVVPIKEDQVIEALQYLVEEQKVEAIAVCLLWSFKNPAHELLIKKLISERYPNLFFTISYEVYPVLREYERMVTTVLNCFTGTRSAKYIQGLSESLKQNGLDSTLRLVQSRGGNITPEEASKKPILLLNSGPVGGVLAARHLGQQLQLKNIITSDMGGTSFDVSMIRNGEILVKSRAEVNGLLTGLTMVDIQAIGAGGGSIAWIDDRGMPRVGPHSAGSRPGPACYNRGGEEATATDVAVLLGIIDPDNFLGGEMRLNKELAEQAVKEKLLSKMNNMDIIGAASAIYKLLVSTMSNAVRTVTVQKGYDPREFTMVAYGGAGGAYICEICKEVDITKIVIPPLASVYSAYGLLLSDDLRSYVHSCNWTSGQSFDEVNGMFDEMIEQGIKSLVNDGYNENEITIIREVDLKFAGQIHEMTISIPNRNLIDDDAAVLHEQFISAYESLYGSGTAWEEAGIQMVNCRITAVGVTNKPQLSTAKATRETDAKKALSGTREVYLPTNNRFETVQVYDRTKMTNGMIINGPCVIDAPDTTIFIPYYGSGKIDEFNNLVISLAKKFTPNPKSFEEESIR